jgi:hypothetical protein
VATLTPEQLREARVRSGRLGGRPRKPTQAEARAAALDELIPAAIKSLAAHLAEGNNPAAWRAALRVFELRYGGPDSLPEPDLDGDGPLDVRKLSSAQRAALMARVLHDHPDLAAIVNDPNGHGA